MSHPAPSRQRHALLAMLFLHTINTYLDRVCISAAAADIQRDLGFSDQMMGYIFGIFALGYGLFQLPAGWFADSYGPRRALAIVVALWSGFTMLTAAAFNALSMLVIRFLFGAGEAGAFPGATRALVNWIPVKDRSLGQGIFHSGARVGAAFSLFLIPLLIRWAGWRWTFVLCGLAGFVWTLAWWRWFRDRPQEHARVNAAELAYIESGLPHDFAAPQKAPLGQILTSANVLLLMLQAVAQPFTFFLSISWLMPYLTKQYGKGAESYAALPPLLAAFSLWLSGLLAERLYARGYHTGSRKAPALLGYVCGAFALLLLTQAGSVVSFILLFSLALFSVEFALTSNWTACMDIGGARAGVVSAAMNMMGQLGSALCAILFPYFVAHVTLPVLATQTGNANSFFVFTAGLNLLAACVWLFINPAKEIVAARRSGLRLAFLIGALSLLLVVVIGYHYFR